VAIPKERKQQKFTWLLQLHQLSSVLGDLTGHVACQHFWSPVPKKGIPTVKRLL